MKCPKCQHENREGAKFCLECGAKLENVCPQCGAKLPPGARFCDECGTKTGDTIPKLEDMHSQLQSLIPEELAQKYATAEPQAAGENRPITALFADISGFTPLSSTQSSETMLQLVQECFRQLVGIVARYEGIISGFRGDGLLALFGAPILHENDAERAIRAAMDMLDAMHDRQLEVTIGINTAPMTVGEIQTQLHREYTAYGTDVILASRLQDAAEPGQILAGTGTHRLTRRIFDFQVVHDLEMQGFPQLVTAYVVQQVKVHPEKLRGIEGLRARMIGREHEFAELKESADEWLNGQGQMVSVIGEAGIGKSRLVAELQQYLETKERELSSAPLLPRTLSPPPPRSPALCLEGRCVSIGQPISYWPFLDILRTYFGFAEDDTEAERAQKVRSRVEELLPNRLDDMLPFLGHLMNLQFGGEIDTRLKHYSTEQISHGTMMRLRELLVAMSEQQRLLLILEDLHWSDDLSLDLVSLLMDELMAHPLMLVCVYRPERKHRVWQLSSQAQRKCLERYTEVPLQKLRDAESRRLVQELLAIEDLPDSVRDMILRKSEGNPFFIEEVIRSLIERGLVYHEDDRWKAREDIVELEVPDTIQSVILARVDRLEAEARYVLQCASVIGRLFKHRLLEHLTQKQRELDRYIAEFEDRDLVYEERTIPELEYAFKHALTQEATYQGILEQRRKVFHRIVAQGIERLYRERIEDFYEELAYHWERGGDDEKTLEYLMKAGEKAAKQYLNNTAIEYYTRAIDLAGNMGVSGDRLAGIYKGRGTVYYNINFHEECISDMNQAAKGYTSRAKRASAYQLISAAYTSHVYDLDAAARYARKVVEEADPKDKSRDTAKAYEGVSIIFIHAIDLEEGERLLRKAIEISEEMGYRDLLAWQYAILTWMYRYHKRFPGSRECLQSAWKKAFSHLPHVKPNLPDYALTCNELAIDAKDYDQKFYLLSEALDAGVKSGSVWPAVESGLQLGALYRGRGETRKAIETYEKAWQIGVRARHVLLGHLVSIIQGLMELCDSQNERQKLLQMMLQMVDSTLVLHSKPEVYPMAQRRWNDTVEEILKTLHNAVPEACGDLEHELRSRLVEADTDGKRFFYRGQLMLLATLDSRPEDAETIARELRKLRQSAGSFAQRISMRMEHIIEMMNARADQRPAVAAKLLKSYDQFEDLWRASDLIVRLVQKDESAQLLDWDHVNRLALQSLQAISGPLRLHNLCNALWRVETLYKMMERPDMFHQVCKQFTDEHPEIRQELGITQLHLEPHEPSASYSRLDSIDTFNGNALEQAWKGGDPDEVCVTELIPSSGLQITVPPGSLRTPSLRQSISGDFAVETRMSDGEAGKKSGGLRVWKDGDNSIHFDASQFGLEGIVQLGFARSGQRLIAGQGLLESEALTLRLERKGDRFTGYVSADDENWYRCGWADIPMEDPVEVGIHTLRAGALATSTRFEYFKIYRPSEQA